MQPQSPTALPDWSRAHGGPLFAGRIRQHAEDFAVTEVLGFEPDGDGEHDLLWIEKTNTNTAWLARQLAQFAGIPARDVGYSGMKDRNAVTRQWFSVRRPAGEPADWSSLQMDGVQVLDVTRNKRKLRRGAHAGNHFRIVIRDLTKLTENSDNRESAPLITTLGTRGVPNYFGEQRFGHHCGNLDLASSLFAGRRLNRDKRSIALSSARAWIFNHVVQQRVQTNTWATIQPGDIAALDGSGSIFTVEQVDSDIQQRSDQLDLHPTGPLWGEGGTPLSTEQSIAKEFPEFVAGLEKHTKAARRPLRMAVRDLSASLDTDVLTLEFYLSRGGFATAVLRELVQT